MAQHQEPFEFVVRIVGWIETDVKHFALAYRSFLATLNIIEAFIESGSIIACCPSISCFWYARA